MSSASFTKGNGSFDKIIEGESKARQDLKSSSLPTKTEGPPVPIIPDDDIDDGDDNFPLITSVFSLASGDENDEAESQEAKKEAKKESPKEVTSPEVTSPEVGIKSPCSPPQENGQVPVTGVRVSTTSPKAGNAPYYVGKGKLILPKTEESKSRTPSKSGMTFSKMVSIHPNSSNDSNVIKKGNLNETSTQTSVVMTRNAVKKSESAQTSHVTGSSVAAPIATTSGDPGPVMVNLSGTLPFLNVKLATTQIAVPPMNTPTSSLSTSVLSSSSALVQLIKKITPTTTTVTPSHGSNVVKSAVPAPAVTSPKSKVPISNLKLQKPRHVNIAPAPTTAISTTRLIMVPQTVSSPVATNQVVSTTQVGSNVPRVVMVPKQSSASSVSTPTSQIMYLIENKTADGKTLRFLIPENAKIITNTIATTNNNNTTSPKTPAAVTIPAASTTAAQLIKIIPKPLQTTNIVTQAPKVAVAAVPSTPTTATTTVIGHAGSLTNTGPPAVNTGNITPPESTSPTINMTTLTSPISEEDSLNTPPISPADTEEPPPADDSMDSGLSPHEARIQKLKELLKKQEDAVERLREKRKKEIEDIRAAPVVTGTNAGVNKRDSPFAVPLPPKKSRLDQSKRKMTETSTQISKDGFLPNSEDQQFVKLVGLEKVVDKIKAKKMLELQQSKLSN